MNKQIVVSAAFRHADLSADNATNFDIREHHTRTVEVFDIVSENLPVDIPENIAVHGDVVTYSRIVEDSRIQAATTSHLVSLPDAYPQLELIGFHSVPRELVDEQYRKYLIDNEKQKETAPERVTDQSEAGR